MNNATKQAGQRRRRLVNQAVNRMIQQLFVNGMGEEADRLVLTSKDGRDLGGLSKGAVIDRLTTILHEMLREMSSSGGKAATKAMTQKQKTRRAKTAALARWGEK